MLTIVDYALLSETELINETADVKYEKLAYLIATLGDSNTLRIFDQASVGFESKKEFIKQLDMTPR